MEALALTLCITLLISRHYTRDHGIDLDQGDPSAHLFAYVLNMN